MLTGIIIENFKGIRERVEIELRPITLLFGGNSAGKSSILHALQYATKIFERRNLDAGSVGDGGTGVDLGGYQNFVHDHNPDLDITLGFNLKFNGNRSFLFANVHFPRFRISHNADSPRSLYQTPESGSVSLTIGWSNLLAAPFVRRYAVILDGTAIAEIQYNPENDLGGDLLLNEQHPIFVRNSEHSALAVWHPDEAENLEESSVIGHLLGWAGLTCAVLVRRPEPAEPQTRLPHPYTVFLRIACQKDALPEFDDLFHIDADWDWGDAVPQSQKALLPDLYFYLTEAISQIVLGPGRVLRKILADSRFLGPIREVPQRHYTRPRQAEQARWSSGLGAWDRLETADDDFIDAVNHWLGDENCLNSGYRLRLKRFKELDLSDAIVVQLLTGRAFDEATAGDRLDLDSLPTQSRVLIVPVNGSIELRPNDVGVGISQVVPVIVTALDGSGWLIAIEQPELHIHPRLQAEIADLFLEASHKQQHQFLIETHSEHCILRLQRRIRETSQGKPTPGRELMSEDVVVYYVSSDDNATRVRRIDIDKHGDFVQPWPDDFFEIDFYERFGHDR